MPFIEGFDFDRAHLDRFHLAASSSPLFPHFTFSASSGPECQGHQLCVCVRVCACAFVCACVHVRVLVHVFVCGWVLFGSALLPAPGYTTSISPSLPCSPFSLTAFQIQAAQ